MNRTNMHFTVGNPVLLLLDETASETSEESTRGDSA
jgi:hypothetical protein